MTFHQLTKFTKFDALMRFHYKSLYFIMKWRFCSKVGNLTKKSIFSFILIINVNTRFTIPWIFCIIVFPIYFEGNNKAYKEEHKGFLKISEGFQKISDAPRSKMFFNWFLSTVKRFFSDFWHVLILTWIQRFWCISKCNLRYNFQVSNKCCPILRFQKPNNLSRRYEMQGLIPRQ